MRHRPAKRQKGIALLALLAVIMLAASWFLLRQLNVESGRMAAVKQNRNAEVLNRAKLALIGYIAAQAIKAGENNPGALPCPEAAGYFDNPTQDGQTASSCTLPKVGRFPWRTIGTEKLVDASGEPLWYVVGPGWAYSGTNPTINSNSVGQLTVDGAPNSAVALIIAPGPAFSVAATAGCAAWNQVRPTTGTPDWRNYLECENATSPADSAFVTTGPSGSFNDQVLTITVADIMPAIEAAVAKRIEREIVPALNAVYAPSSWGTTAAWGNLALSNPDRTNPIYPFATPFGPTFPDPSASDYKGVLGTYQGLLPFNQTQGCTAGAANPRCLPSLISWNGTPTNATETLGNGYIQAQSCYWVSTDIRECYGQYHEDTWQPWQPVRIQMTASFNNVAMGLRAVDTTKFTVEAKDNITSGPWQSLTPDYSATMDSNGRLTFTFGAVMPNIDTKGWGTYADFRIRIDRAAIGDHALLNTSDATIGWFARNEWYRLAYYAVVQGHTAAALPSAPTCITNSNCLSVANVTPGNAQRAILILTGRSINGTARPSSTLANYLEFGNATGAYERRTVSASVATPLAQRFNDRIVVVGSN
jgi:hypothetical protein